MSDLLAQIAERYENSTRSLEVREWGTTVYWTPLTLAEHQAARTGLSEDDDGYAFTVSVIVEKLQDSTGKPLFPEPAKAKATLLSKAEASVVQRIFRHIVGEDGLEEAKNA